MHQDEQKTLFILSIDTEEEWDWDGPFPEGDFAVSNIYELPAFQAFCNSLGIIPTYFVDYAVLDNPNSCRVLQGFNKQHCEFAAHLHPWANPPYFEKTTELLSHVVNLPIEETKQKLALLIDKIQTTLTINPTAFRTGRWGINGEILDLLSENNFSVDSSVYPLYRNQYFDCFKAPLYPYYPNKLNPAATTEHSTILEIPVTCDFNITNSVLADKIHSRMQFPPFNWIKANGILWHTGLLKKLYLSPELCNTKDMCQLIDIAINKKLPVLHMYMHSSSLVEGVTGLTQSADARETICARIKDVVEYAQSRCNLQFCSISEAKQILVK